MGCLRTCKAKFKTSEIRVMLGGAEISQEVRRCEAAHLQNFCKLVAVGASVRMRVCAREHLLIRKMKVFFGEGGALPSNASYQRLNTERCGVKRCTTSRLLIDTSD